ncbi:MAG: LuxR C-terminal-related transcriptional regulator [Actinobacteria bacterium]|nr:LuxR C-terminal-related transcriptional regulator [Actinomycetota bacterium]
MSAIPANARAVERVTRVCGAHDEARALRLALLDEIQRAAGFDAYSWLLTDPETEVGCAPLADVPCLPELPRLIRLKYLTAVNRWTQLDVPAALLRAATGDRRERSLVWRELLASYGVNDVASVVFRDRFGCWAFLELWRIDSGARFTTAEAGFLTGIAAPVTEALRRCQARTFELVASAPDRTGPVVLMLSPQLEVRAQTPETDRYLRILVPPDADRRPIPSGAYNVAAQLLAVEAGIDHHPPSARVHLSGGVWLTLRAARIGEVVPTDQQDIAVTIEATSAAERTALFARAFGLSAREAELLSHLVAGSDTHRIARQMFLSEHTVQDHLKSIFAKTATRNRRTLLARATGR